jgi:signal transduction histidine kinase
MAIPRFAEVEDGFERCARFMNHEPHIPQLFYHFRKTSRPARRLGNAFYGMAKRRGPSRVTGWFPQILLGLSLLLTVVTGFQALRVAQIQRMTATMLRENQSLPPGVRRTAAAFMASQGITARAFSIVGQLVLSFSLILVAVYQMRRQAALVRMRTEFVSSVSHELRTPLAQIQLFLETLSLGRFHNEGERDWIFDNMQREITRLTSLVNNVLQFSRIERGALSGTARQNIELAAYLNEIADGFKPLAAVQENTIETSLEDGIVVSIQPDMFRQAMLNLLDNAVKYGPRGQTITVASQTLDESVRIIVEDRGRGISPDDRDRIWEPYQRGESADGTVGTGIGLSVVREVVHAHSGDVSIEQPASGGSRFVITLPRVV